MALERRLIWQLDMTGKVKETLLLFSEEGWLAGASCRDMLNYVLVRL